MTQRQRQSKQKVADSLFAQYIRARDVFCQRCGGTEVLQCAHVISRRYAATRFAPLNAMLLCRSCHMWQTVNPLEGEDWFREQLGSEIFEELRRVALAGGPVDYKTLIPDLRRRLEAAA